MSISFVTSLIAGTFESTPWLLISCFNFCVQSLKLPQPNSHAHFELSDIVALFSQRISREDLGSELVSSFT